MTDVLHYLVVRTHTLRVELGKPITRGSVKNRDSRKDGNRSVAEGVGCPCSWKTQMAIHSSIDQKDVWNYGR
jgi:hypothetical protein